MFDDEPSCFGKLPFNLLDRLQGERGHAYWADAVFVPSKKTCLTSIDTVLLNSDDLPNSIGLGILHAMNDLFAANSLPSWFSISMTLPPEVDADELSRINRAIDQCSAIVGCEVGKLHTIRASEPPSMTVCVCGGATGLSSNVAENGAVVIVGHDLTATNRRKFSTEIARKEVETRKTLCCSISGPKKDVSGDGLGGTLVQLSRREAVTITLSEESLRKLTRVPGDGGLERNYFDFASAIRGQQTDELRVQLFAPRIFGPLVCLVAELTDLDPSTSIAIGSFERGQAEVRISAP